MNLDHLNMLSQSKQNNQIYKILIDIGHPAHIHYFRNFAEKLKYLGFEFHFTVRNKESAIKLAENYKLSFTPRGQGGSNIVTKLLLLPIIDFKVYKIAKLFKPDLILSFASPYAAHVSRLIGVPHIAFDDTEHAKIAHKFYRPFTDLVLSPSCYTGSLDTNQILFNSYMELAYLHPNYFKDDVAIYNDLGIPGSEKYVILRFISWNANHDVGQKGLSLTDKIELVRIIEKHARVFISSESDLPKELINYKLKIKPDRLHQALRFASLYIGEGSTTATEAALLGTPAIYVNSQKRGYCTELQEKYGQLFQITQLDEILNHAEIILCDTDSKSKFERNRIRILEDKIDTTQFMTDFVYNHFSKKTALTLLNNL